MLDRALKGWINPVRALNNGVQKPSEMETLSNSVAAGALGVPLHTQHAYERSTEPCLSCRLNEQEYRDSSVH
jgi:hypothetical protein